MKFFLLICGFLVTTGLSFAQTAEGNRVLELSKRKFEWMVSRRSDSLQAMLDDRLKYIHSTGWVQTKKEVIEDMMSGKLKYQSIDLKEIDVREYPSTMIVTGKGKFSGTLKETPFVSELSFTEVYVLKNKSWFLASRHANKMP